MNNIATDIGTGRKAVGATITTLKPKSTKSRRIIERSPHRNGETQKAVRAVGRADRNQKPSDVARGHLSTDGQLGSDTPEIAAVGADDQVLCETQFAPVVSTIQELWRRRQSWHRAEKSLTLQAKAICRRYVGGDKDEADKLFATVEGQGHSEIQGKAAPVTVAILPLMMARETMETHRAAVEKELAKLAKQLPVYPWCEAVRGFGPMSLAALVGECGNVGGYKSVSAIWKRMGLAVVNGERQRRVTGPDALLHGYAPQRRSVAWNIGVALMRSQKTGQPYRDFYDTDKAKQLAKGLTKGHAHNRACRHMTKKLLANFYGAWTLSIEALPSTRMATKPSRAKYRSPVAR